MRTLLHSFDKRYTKIIQSWPSGFRPIMLFATLVGQPVFTLGIATLVAGVGFGSGNIQYFLAGLFAVFTLGVGTILKITLRRNRPLTDYVMNMRFDTFSLPSGHSVGAVASYGLLAAICGTTMATPFHIVVPVLIGILVIFIGLSRIYLGAHYPSDVLAGWLLGSLGLIGILFILGK